MRLVYLLLLASQALAYNSPVDTAGPLTVSMQPAAVGAYGAGGYADLSRPNVPFVVPVTLQNSSDREISGTLRLAVIDRWKVEPAAAVEFRLGPHGRSRQEFTLTFGPGTLSAHYPIHAYAAFEYQGRKLIAHPVMIVQTRLPDLVRPALPVEWKPVRVPNPGTLGLWRNPVRRERTETIHTGADAGQQGREVFDAGTVILYGPLAGGDKEGIAMTLGPRPPSRRETVDAASVEYLLDLPAARTLRLEFAVRGRAMFTVKAGPAASGELRTVYEHRPAGRDAEAAVADLAAFAGTSLRLRLEVRDAPGEAQWVEPTIVAGDAPQPVAFPPSGAPASVLGKAGGCEIQLWRGFRGALDAPVGLLCGERKLFFRGFRVRVAGDSLEDWRSGTELVEAREETAAGRYRVRHRFRNWAGTFDLMSELSVEHDALRARFWLENAPPPKPWFQLYLEAVSAGAWSEKALRVYAGPGNVIVDPKAFRLGFDGHNLATSFVGFDFANALSLVQNSDAIPDRLEVTPEARIYSLVTPHPQTLEFYPAASAFAAVKRLRENDTRTASKGVAKLAGRFTFDLWSQPYAKSAADLNRAAEYGIANALVVLHNWQRWGYDYRLPDIYPPNPEYGTEEEFRQLVEACRRHGTLFAPHDNYIDFYPDFEGFSYDAIVFRQNGSPFKAWFNYGREAQAYRARPDRLMPYVERNLRLIKQGFAPSAYFIDVWSSASPYDYWTPDGRFVDRAATQRVWGGAFAWIRDFLGGDAPQISEAGHDKLIGWLDGAQAQQLRVDSEGKDFTWKISCGDSERIPWIDVAWHDKFILHGAGYEGRYQGGLDRKEHGAYSDDYVTTEVLSGRPAMVPQAFNRDVVRVHWLLNDAMTALSLDRISGVEFAGDDIHRQHVKWESGAEVWVNRGASPWVVEGHTLPRYGFYLRAGKVEAAIEVAGGGRVEWSRSPGRRYENGRLTADGKVLELPR